MDKSLWFLARGRGTGEVRKAEMGKCFPEERLGCLKCGGEAERILRSRWEDVYSVASCKKCEKELRVPGRYYRVDNASFPTWFALFDAARKRINRRINKNVQVDKRALTRKGNKALKKLQVM